MPCIGTSHRKEGVVSYSINPSHQFAKPMVFDIWYHFDEPVFQIEARTELRLSTKAHRSRIWLETSPSRQLREHASNTFSHNFENRKTTMPCFHLITSVA